VEEEGEPLAKVEAKWMSWRTIFLQNTYYQLQLQHALSKHAQAESPAVRKNRVTSSDRRELNSWQAKTKVRSLCDVEIALLLP